jgi:hypothetical protein
VIAKQSREGWFQTRNRCLQRTIRRFYDVLENGVDHVIDPSLQFGSIPLRRERFADRMV